MRVLAIAILAILAVAACSSEPQVWTYGNVPHEPPRDAGQE